MKPPADCRELAECGAILDRLAAALQIVGSTPEVMPTAQLLYLAMVTRLTADPVSVVVKAGSSAGKSWIVDRVLAFFPPSAFHSLTGMTQRLLVYDNEPLIHRMLIVCEADGFKGEVASALLRSLLSEGSIRYGTVESVKGVLTPRHIFRPGPVGLITTTAQLGLDAELETRLLSLSIPDTREQTRLVMMAQGRRFAHSEAGAVDYRPWVALQSWLEADPVGVDVPFGEQLGATMADGAQRLRRDVIKVLALVQAHALLHRASRELDGHGQVVATIEGDFAPVQRLVGPVIAAGVESGVKRETRDTVNAVVRLLDDRPASMAFGAPSVSIVEMARGLGLERSSVSRRVADAVEQGLLVNLETRRGQPARIVLGDWMGDDAAVLPSVAALRAANEADGA